jgi:hypothetical protein
MGSLNSDWLSQLAPAHAPTPVGWWPPAPGWWAIAVLLLLTAAAVVYRFSRPAGRLRRVALRELRAIEAAAHDDARLAAEAEHLLRRYAVAAYGRKTVARLSGAAWLAFVVEHGGTQLAGTTGQAMLLAAYGGQARIDRRRLLDGVRAFIRARR